MGGMKAVAHATQNAKKASTGATIEASENSFKMQEFLSGSDYNAAKVELIRRTVAKGCSDLELAYFLSVAKGVGLNPLVKEIWCYKDNKGNQIIFAGRDGFHRLLHACKDFVSMNSCEVREGDKFKRGTKNGEDYVEHEFAELAGDDPKGAKDRFKKRILGAYSVVKVKRNGVISNVVEWADMQRYDKKWNVWESHPEEMIKKVAEIHAAKKVTNISGIYTEEEFEIVEDEKTGEKIVNTDALKIKAGIDKKEMLRRIQAAKSMKKSKK